MDGLLRSRRKRSSWFLGELSQRSGVSYVTIYRIEAGTINPTVATLEKLAGPLGISARDLIPMRKRSAQKGGR